ncbi:methyltransferase family protein [Phragmitibacter flavus]|nr:isoprenylcysteine carboxylmethyltransferase family protein [Phragmitibacter flavus]
MAGHDQVEVMMAVMGLLLVAMGVWGRIWCTLYIGGRKDQMLVTDGPYARCRNPLYFFSALAGLGVAAAAGSVVVLGVVMAFFAVGYHFVIRAEEKKLLGLHGESFLNYCKEVPRFWMRLRLQRSMAPEQQVFSSKLFHRTSRDASWFFVAWSAVLWVKILHQSGALPCWWNIP